MAFGVFQRRTVGPPPRNLAHGPSNGTVNYVLRLG